MNAAANHGRMILHMTCRVQRVRHQLDTFAGVHPAMNVMCIQTVTGWPCAAVCSKNVQGPKKKGLNSDTTQT